MVEPEATRMADDRREPGYEFDGERACPACSRTFETAEAMYEHLTLHDADDFE